MNTAVTLLFGDEAQVGREMRDIRAASYRALFHEYAMTTLSWLVSLAPAYPIFASLCCFY